MVYKEEKHTWEPIYRSSGILKNIGAGTDLLIIETENGGKLVTFEFGATEANFFNVVIRDIGGAALEPKWKVYRLYADGQYVDAETFDEPILEWGAGKEIAITNEEAGGLDQEYIVNMKVYTPIT
jgi:hypothetical protein